MTRKFLQNPLQKENGLVGSVMIPAAKQSSQIIPRLPNETKQGMITLPALLLRIVAHRRPLLPIKNRGHMGIQIQGQGLEDSKALAKLHQQTKIQKSNLFPLHP